jgi:hypothetical protein
MQDILSTITTFGSVSIETSPPSVVIKTTKDNQAQIVSVMQHLTVKSILSLYHCMLTQLQLYHLDM